MARKRKRSTEIPGIVVALCCTIVVAQSDYDVVADKFDQEIKGRSASMDSIRSELEQGRKQLAKLEEKEGTYLQRLERLEQNIATAEAYVKGIGGEIDSISTGIDSLESELEDAGKQLATRQEKMKRRLRNMYKTGRVDIFEIILTSASVADLLHRVRYFQELVSYDTLLMHGIDSTRMYIDSSKAHLEEEREVLVSRKNEKVREQEQLLAETESRQSIIDEIKTQKQAYLAMIEELEAAQQQLDVLITQLEKKKAAARVEYERGLSTEFEKRKGKLPWPIAGDVVRTFGKIVHPVYKTVTMNNGIDIASDRGEQVLCVAPGKVVYVGRMRGLGTFVVVDHFGGYMTIYAHLDRVSVPRDKTVEYGTVLGRVGDSGSISGVQLHFEIRKSTDSVNPLEWLEKRDL